VRFSPILTAQSTYPFVRLEQAKRRALADGIELVDLGLGDPRELTPELVRRALIEALPERSSYPKAEGLPELRAAIARWCALRFHVDLDPDTEIVPTLGSKEAIFSFAQVVVERGGDRDLVAVTEPGYPVAERGAQFAGADVVRLPLAEEHGFLPDLDSLDEAMLDRLAILWVNYPNNPTGAIAPLAFYERLAELALEHDFLLASDEAYSEIWFDAPPDSALQVRDRANVVVFNTLSKRSSMTGYRSGFVAAAPEVIAALKTFRPSVGTAPQEFVQKASIAAWDDEEHVEQTRAIYRRKRELLLGALGRRGLHVAGSTAGLFLWVEVPGTESSEDFAERALQHGLVVAPGSYLGAGGEGWVRLALVPTEEECARAAELIESLP
jgi:succinyldiaminopimelate transaminase